MYCMGVVDAPQICLKKLFVASSCSKRLDNICNKPKLSFLTNFAFHLRFQTMNEALTCLITDVIRN